MLRKRVSNIIHRLAATPTACFFSGAVENQIQYLKSPNYPSSYSPDADCIYRLYSPEGTYIKLEFVNFETEECCDKLSVSSSLNTDCWLFS